MSELKYKNISLAINHTNTSAVPSDADNFISYLSIIPGDGVSNRDGDKIKMAYIKYKFYVTLAGKVDSASYNATNRIFRFIVVQPKNISLSSATELDLIGVNSVIDKTKFFVLKDFRFNIDNDTRTFKSSSMIIKTRYNFSFGAANTPLQPYPIMRLVSEEINPGVTDNALTTGVIVTGTMFLNFGWKDL